MTARGCLYSNKVRIRAGHYGRYEKNRSHRTGPPVRDHDPGKALRYFDELIKKYPQTPWAFQGRAWRALLTTNLTSEEKRRRLQADLRSKDSTIRTLRTQLGRSREIDIEIDKKERELLR